MRDTWVNVYSYIALERESAIARDLYLRQMSFTYLFYGCVLLMYLFSCFFFLSLSPIYSPGFLRARDSLSIVNAEIFISAARMTFHRGYCAPAHRDTESFIIILLA